MKGQAPSAGDAVLTLSNLACARGGRMLFSGLDVMVQPGGALLVTGPNGAGKSSLIRLIAGLLAPAAGKVRVNGRLALLGEESALDAELTLARALAFWAKLDGVGVAAVAAALIDVDLEALAPVPVRLLSTGQRRRAALARVVASAAPLWLLDEPGNGLDMAAVTNLERLVARHRAAGGAVVVATHLPLAVPGAQAVRL